MMRAILIMMTLGGAAQAQMAAPAAPQGASGSMGVSDRCVCNALSNAGCAGRNGEYVPCESIISNGSGGVGGLVSLCLPPNILRLVEPDTTKVDPVYLGKKLYCPPTGNCLMADAWTTPKVSKPYPVCLTPEENTAAIDRANDQRGGGQ